MSTPHDIDQALERLKAAAIVIADILDAGERDPRWAESQELENAAIAYGRVVRIAPPPKNTKRQRK